MYAFVNQCWQNAFGLKERTTIPYLTKQRNLQGGINLTIFDQSRTKKVDAKVAFGIRIYFTSDCCSDKVTRREV